MSSLTRVCKISAKSKSCSEAEKLIKSGGSGAKDGDDDW
jgi:hypothetical protein